jgi:hypothetical protein
MKLNTIDFDSKRNDFLVNRKPLLEHLQKHEDVIAKRHIMSALSQPGACDRLLGLSEPDLQHEHVSIYLCSHCGGYDGNPIGVKLEFTDNSVIWKEIGYYYDYAEADPFPFNSVVEYAFPITQYKELIERLRTYEPRKA